MTLKQTLASVLVASSILSTTAMAVTADYDWTYSPYFADFSDIPKNVPVDARPWYYEFVYSMADKGYITGFEDGTFGPFQNLTMAQFCSIIANGFLGETLIDVMKNDYSAWWAPYMVAMEERGCFKDTMLDGVPFSQWGSYVNVELTRYEASAILSNLLTDRRHSEPNIATADRYLIPYADMMREKNANSAIYQQYGTKVSYVILEKVMFGKDDGLFHGEDILNRAEAAAVLRVLINKETFVKSPETYADAIAAAEKAAAAEAEAE